MPYTTSEKHQKHFLLSESVFKLYFVYPYNFSNGVPQGHMLGPPFLFLKFSNPPEVSKSFGSQLSLFKKPFLMAQELFFNSKIMVYIWVEQIQASNSHGMWPGSIKTNDCIRQEKILLNMSIAHQKTYHWILITSKLSFLNVERLTVVNLTPNLAIFALESQLCGLLLQMAKR